MPLRSASAPQAHSEKRYVDWVSTGSELETSRPHQSVDKAMSVIQHIKNQSPGSGNARLIILGGSAWEPEWISCAPHQVLSNEDSNTRNRLKRELIEVDIDRRTADIRLMTIARDNRGIIKIRVIESSMVLIRGDLVKRETAR